jgi:hypothetical protein
MFALPAARYIFRAYFYPGDITSMRSYPTIEPTEHFSGRWIHYAYAGRKLAVLSYRDGEEDGRQIYYDDSGQPFLIRYIANGRFDHDDVRLPPPKRISIPFFFPQRWLNPSI